MIKLIEANPKANRVFSLRPTLIPIEDNKASAPDMDVTITMEVKDAQQAMQNVTFAIKQDTLAICAINVIDNNSNKHL